MRHWVVVTKVKANYHVSHFLSLYALKEILDESYIKQQKTHCTDITGPE